MNKNFKWELSVGDIRNANIKKVMEFPYFQRLSGETRRKELFPSIIADVDCLFVKNQTPGVDKTD